MSVHLDGSTLSALLFNHFNSSGNQYGFLTGEKIEHIEDKISDSQIHAYDVNSYIYVSSFVPWPSGECIYDRSGHISDEWLQRLFLDREQSLVGWYSLRHNTSSRPSLRESNLHKNLATLERFSGDSQDFLYFLCTSSSSANMSTHTCDYGFMHTIDGRFLNLPMTVMNLGDTTRKEYRKRSNASLFHSKTIQGSLQSFQKDFSKSSGEMEHVVKVKQLASSLNKSLASVQSKIAESEAALGLLEADVDDLRQQVGLLEEEEVETMFQIEAENRRKKIEEEMIKQNAEEAEEQEQLQKLLIDLGMSSEDMHYRASVVSNLQPEVDTFENYVKDQSAASFQVMNPSPSLSKERASVNSSNRNTNCALESSSTTALPDDKHVALAHKKLVNGTDHSANKTKNTQTMKDSTLDTFQFLEDEFKFNQSAVAKRQQITDSSRGKNTGILMTSDLTCGKQVKIDIHQLSQCKDEFIIPNVQNERSQQIHEKRNNSPLRDTFDSTNETSANVDMRVDDHETSQSDLDTCDDKYIGSSSPVF